MIFVGVELSSLAVKAVSVRKVDKRITILNSHYLPLEESDFGPESKKQTLSHLKKLKVIYSSSDCRFIFSLPQNLISELALSFPFKEKYKILKALPFEMENKHSLFSSEKLISDIKITDSLPGKTHVIVFSCIKDQIRALLDITKQAGISPYLITCEASASSGLLESSGSGYQYPPPQMNGSPPEDTSFSFSFSIKKRKFKNQNQPGAKEPAEKKEEDKQYPSKLFLKIGHNHSIVMVISGNKLRDIYNFSWGTDFCIRALALKYKISKATAFKEFCSKAFILTGGNEASGDQKAFSTVITHSMDSLVQKLRLLVLKLQGDKVFSFEKMYIYGGGSQIKNLPAYLSRQLNLEVLRLDHPVFFPEWDMRQNKGHQNNLFTALGAAMEGFKKLKYPPVNFLREEFAHNFQPFSFLSSTWRSAIVIGFFMFSLFSIYSVLRNSQSQNLADKSDYTFKRRAVQITRMPARQATLSNIQNYIKTNAHLFSHLELEERLSHIPSALDRIQSLSIAIKKAKTWNLYITKLSILGNRIEIKGFINREHLTTFKEHLSDLAVKQKVKDLNSSEETKGLSADSAESKEDRENIQAGGEQALPKPPLRAVADSDEASGASDKKSLADSSEKETGDVASSSAKEDLPGSLPPPESDNTKETSDPSVSAGTVLKQTDQGISKALAKGLEQAKTSSKPSGADSEVEQLIEEEAHDTVAFAFSITQESI